MFFGPSPSLLRRHPDFRLLLIGETASELGSAVSLVALPLVAVLALHASTFQVATLSAVGTVGWPVIGLPVGVWVDRWARRPVLILTDLGRGFRARNRSRGRRLGCLEPGAAVRGGAHDGGVGHLLLRRL
jgi:MFS family permease